MRRVQLTLEYNEAAALLRAARHRRDEITGLSDKLSAEGLHRDESREVFRAEINDLGTAIVLLDGAMTECLG